MARRIPGQDGVKIHDYRRQKSWLSQELPKHPQEKTIFAFGIFEFARERAGDRAFNVRVPKRPLLEITFHDGISMHLLRRAGGQ